MCRFGASVIIGGGGGAAIDCGGLVSCAGAGAEVTRRGCSTPLMVYLSPSGEEYIMCSLPCSPASMKTEADVPDA